MAAEAGKAGTTNDATIATAETLAAKRIILLFIVWVIVRKTLVIVRPTIPICLSSNLELRMKDFFDGTNCRNAFVFCLPKETALPSGFPTTVCRAFLRQTP